MGNKLSTKREYDVNKTNRNTSTIVSFSCDICNFHFNTTTNVLNYYDPCLDYYYYYKAQSRIVEELSCNIEKDIRDQKIIINVVRIFDLSKSNVKIHKNIKKSNDYTMCHSCVRTMFPHIDVILAKDLYNNSQLNQLPNHNHKNRKFDSYNNLHKIPKNYCCDDCHKINTCVNLDESTCGFQKIGKYLCNECFNNYCLYDGCRNFHKIKCPCCGNSLCDTHWIKHCENSLVIKNILLCDGIYEDFYHNSYGLEFV